MANKLGDHAETRLSMASLFAAFAKTMNESDHTFSVRFEENLEAIYRNMEDAESEPLGAMETLRWTKEILHK